MCCDKKFSATNVNVLLHGCADAQLAQDKFCEIPKQSIPIHPVEVGDGLLCRSRQPITAHALAAPT